MDGYREIDIDKISNELFGVPIPNKPTATETTQPNKTVKTKKPTNGLDVPTVLDDEFAKLGWSPNARMAIIANVGRENDWNPNTIFAEHIDPASYTNGRGIIRNRGIISWNNERRDALEKFVRNNGGDFSVNENNLRLQARFLDQEMRTGRWGKIADKVGNQNLSVDDYYPVFQKYILYQPRYEYDNKRREQQLLDRGFTPQQIRQMFDVTENYDTISGALFGNNSNNPNQTNTATSSLDADAISQSLFGTQPTQQNSVIPQNYNNTTAVTPNGQQPIGSSVVSQPLDENDSVTLQRQNLERDLADAIQKRDKKREQEIRQSLAIFEKNKPYSKIVTPIGNNPAVQSTNQAMPLNGNSFDVQQNPQLAKLERQRAEFYRQRDEATKNNTPQKVLEIRPMLDKVEAEISQLQNSSADIVLPANPLTTQTEQTQTEQTPQTQTFTKRPNPTEKFEQDGFAQTTDGKKFEYLGIGKDNRFYFKTEDGKTVKLSEDKTQFENSEQSNALTFTDENGTWEQSPDQSGVDSGLVRFTDPQTKKTRVVKLSADGQQIADVYDESNFSTEYETYAQTETANGKTPLTKEQYLDSQYQEYLKNASKNRQKPITKDEFAAMVEKPALTQVSGYRTNVQQNGQTNNQQNQQQQTNVNQSLQQPSTRTVGVGGVNQDAATVSNKGRINYRNIKDDADFLNAAVGSVDVDLSKKPAGMDADEFIMRSAMQTLGGRFGVNSDQINSVIAEGKKSGFWSSGRSYNNQKTNSPIVTITLSYGLFNRALGGNTTQLSEEIRNARADQQLEGAVTQSTQPKPINYDIPLNEVSSVQQEEAEKVTRAQVGEDIGSLSGSELFTGILSEAMRSPVSRVKDWWDGKGYFSIDKNSPLYLPRTKAEYDEALNTRLGDILREEGSFYNYQRTVKNIQNMDNLEFTVRLGANFVRGLVNQVAASTFKGLDTVDSLLEYVSPFTNFGKALGKDSQLGKFLQDYNPSLRTLENLVNYSATAILGKTDRFRLMTQDAPIEDRMFYTLGQGISETLGEDKYLRKNVLGTLSNGMGSATGFLLLGILAPSANVGKGLAQFNLTSGLTGALSQSGEMYSQARQKGLSEGDSRFAALMGVPLGATEGFGVGAIIGKSLNTTERRTLLSIITEYYQTPAGRKALIEAGKQNLRQKGATFLKEFAEEGGQETLRGTGEDTLWKFLQEKNKSLFEKIQTAVTNLPDVAARNVVERGLIGGLTGGIFGVGVNSIVNRGDSVNWNGQKATVIDAVPNLLNGEPTITIKTEDGKTQTVPANEIIDLNYNDKTGKYEYRNLDQTFGGQKVENKSQEDIKIEQLKTSQTPRELQDRNPLRAETANPQAIEKVKKDSRAQKISEVLADGSAKSVSELQKLTRYNQKNISETIDSLYQARVVEILPDNTVRLISDVPKAENINLYEKYSNQPIKLNESSEIQADTQNGQVTAETKGEIQTSDNTRLRNSESKAENKPVDIVQEAAKIYDNLPQQKLQEVKTEKPVAKIDFATRENIGEKLNVFTERGTKAQIQPKVVESSDLLTSLDPNYPQEFQPRDRSRAASKAQVADIANKLNPEFLGDSPKASDGRPLVVPVEMPDGSTKYAVISGNGRTAAIRQAYSLENEGSQKYAEFVRSKGDTNAKEPVYVGILDPKEIENFAEFAKESNESATAQMSAAEQARSDADRLDASVLNLFVPSDDGTIHGASNRDFVREFLDRTTTVAERGRFIDAQGKLSQEGVTRVRNAVFAKAFGESEMGMATLSRMAESTDSNIKNITNALLAKAGELASFAQAAKDNRRYKELDIAPDFARAMEKYSELKDGDVSIDEYIAQGNLFGADTSPLQTRIMQVFDFYKRRSKSIRHIIDNYIAASEAIGDPNQQSLFGESFKPSKESIFEGAVRSYEESIIAEPQSVGLFDENQGRETRSDGSSESNSSFGNARGEIAQEKETGIAKIESDDQTAPKTESESDRRLPVRSNEKQSLKVGDTVLANGLAGGEIVDIKIPTLGPEKGKQLFYVRKSASGDVVVYQENELQSAKKDGNSFSAISNSATDAAFDAATSPLNNLPMPSNDELRAGNYKKGHITIGGLNITVENPVGSERKGVDRDGKAWSVTMKHHYGYIKRTIGADEENLDVFVKNDTPEDFSGDIYIVDQIHPDNGKFDEHKIMIGFDSEAEARAAYLANYAKDWKGLQAIAAMTLEDFKTWKDKEQREPAKDSEETETYKFSSTQVNLSPDVAKNVRAFGKALIPKSELSEDGYEENPHITVKYGIHSEDGRDIEPILSGENYITAKLGKTAVFSSNPDYDVVIIEVESKDLQKLNKKIAENTEVTDTFPNYTPHVTLAYVKKGEGAKYAGRNDFEGVELKFDSVEFSSKSGEKTEIPLENARDNSDKLNNYGAKNKLISQEKADKAREVLRKKLRDNDLDSPLYQLPADEQNIYDSIVKDLTKLSNQFNKLKTVDEKINFQSEILKKAEAKQIENELFLNPEANEMLRQAHQIAFGDAPKAILGTYQNPTHTQRVFDALRFGVLGHLNLTAKPFIQKFADAVDNKHGDTRIIALDRDGNYLKIARAEESAHQADYRVGLKHSVGKDVVLDSQDGRMAVQKLQEGAYDGASDGLAAMEVIAKSFVPDETETGLSKEQKKKLRKEYYRALAKAGKTSEDMKEFAEVSDIGRKFAEKAQRYERIQRNSRRDEPLETQRTAQNDFGNVSAGEARRERTGFSDGYSRRQPRNLGTGFLEGTRSQSFTELLDGLNPDTEKNRQNQTLEQYQKPLNTDIAVRENAPLYARTSTENQQTAEEQKSIARKVFSVIYNGRSEDATPKIEVLTNFRRAGLLTSPKTHLRNIISNGINQASEEVIRPLAVLADLAASAVTGKRTVGFVSPTAVIKSFAALVRADKTMKSLDVKSGFSKAWSILRHGDIRELEKNQLSEMRSGFPILDGVINMTFRALGAEDALFKTYAIRRSLEEQAMTIAATKAKDIKWRTLKEKADYIKAQKQNLLENPTNEMLLEAMLFADFTTFTNDNPISDWFKKVKDTHYYSKVVLETIVPYDKTPTNIVLRTLEHTPLGFVWAGKHVYDLKKENSYTFENIREQYLREYSNEDTKQKEIRQKINQKFDNNIKRLDELVKNAKTEKERNDLIAEKARHQKNFQILQGKRKLEDGFREVDRQEIEDSLKELFPRVQQQLFARSFGRAGLGTSALALGIYLAMNGLLSGVWDASDKEEGKEFFNRRDSGVLNGSLLIGNRRYQINDTPLGKTMVLGASIWERYQKDDKKKKGLSEFAEDSKDVGGKLIFEQPLLNSLDDYFGSNKPLEKRVGGLLGSFVPSIIADVADVSDNEARQTDTLDGATMNRLPGIRFLNDKAKRPREKYLQNMSNRVINKFDPFNSRPTKEKATIKPRK